ncbi:sugar phosphate isomerase/epimerase family protein [Actinomadura roseirufa]|uniref:sugar phosphate isomerase/epimerase family protein n=1 Tax=Actinomadura roseirufa TaxID=2094049 RepID=UPI0013F14E6F|nr:sugar phosphate isomerase/epimerase family protein [Actinomadura roseirufa]
MRFSVATVSLPTLTPEEAVTTIASLGYGGVEWRVASPDRPGDPAPPHPFLSGNLCTLEPGVPDGERARRLCAVTGLAVVGLGPYADLGDTGAVAELMRMAAAAGAPQIRLQAPRISRTGLPYGELFARTAAFFEEVEGLAAEHGVRAALEIHHNTICPSASLAHRLVSRFDPRRIGVIYDVGNLVFEGYEDPRIGLDLLGPYVVHVHLKNALCRQEPGTERWRYAWSPLESGVLDVPAVLECLDGFGFEGWVSLEDLSTDRDPVATLRHNARLLRTWGFL